MQKKICFIIITLLAILGMLIMMYNFIIKMIYKTEYSEYVYKYAEEEKIDPSLIFAMIKAESNFNSKAESSAKAIGLMQLLESTASEVANELGIEFSKELLYNAEVNIQLGVKYFSNLVDQYKGNINLAILAYNAGKSNVDKWIEEGIIQIDGSNIENVPFKETNMYARRVLRDYNIYKALYKI